MAMKRIFVIVVVIAFCMILCSCKDCGLKDEVEGLDISGNWEGTFPNGTDVSAKISGNIISLYIDSKEVMNTGIYNYLQQLSDGNKMIFFMFDDRKVLGTEGVDLLGYVEHAYIPYYNYSETDDNVSSVKRLCFLISSTNHIDIYEIYLSRIN